MQISDLIYSFTGRNICIYRDDTFKTVNVSRRFVSRSSLIGWVDFVGVGTQRKVSIRSNYYIKITHQIPSGMGEFRVQK